MNDRYLLTAILTNDTEYIKQCMHRYIYHSSTIDFNPLNVAITVGRLGAIRQIVYLDPFLLERSLRDVKNSPLIVAIGHNWKSDDLKQLIEILGVSQCPFTLHCAVIMNKPDVLKLFIDFYHLSPTVKNQRGETAI